MFLNALICVGVGVAADAAAVAGGATSRICVCLLIYGHVCVLCGALGNWQPVI